MGVKIGKKVDVVSVSFPATNFKTEVPDGYDVLESVLQSTEDNKPGAQINDLAAQVDEIAVLKGKIDQAKNLLDVMTSAYDNLRANILNQLPPDKLNSKLQLTGKQYTISLSEPAKVSVLAEPAVIVNVLEKMQPGLSTELMSFKVGDLKKYLPPQILGKVLNEEKTGPRRWVFKRK